MILVLFLSDLNECTEMENACSGYDNICVNTEGSFTCRCDSGVKDETPPNTRLDSG